MIPGAAEEILGRNEVKERRRSGEEEVNHWPLLQREGKNHEKRAAEKLRRGRNEDELGPPDIYNLPQIGRAVWHGHMDRSCDLDREEGSVDPDFCQRARDWHGHPDRVCSWDRPCCSAWPNGSVDPEIA